MGATGASDSSGVTRRYRRYPRWLRPAVTAYVIAGVAVTVWGQFTQSVPTRLVALDIAVGLAGCALTPVMLRWPTAPTLALGALAVLSPAATPAATVAALYVAYRRRFPVAAAVAAVGAAGTIARDLWRPAGGLSFTWWVVAVIAGYAALLGWGALVRANGALIASLRERARRAEEEQGRRVAEARLLERTRIAREMHDVLAHRLSLLATYAGALEYRPDAPPEQLSRAAAVIRSGAHEALEELRDVIGVLRDEPGDGGPERGGGDAGKIHRPQPNVTAGGGADGGRPGSDPAAARDPEWPQPTLDDLPRLAGESRAAGTPVRLQTRLPEASVVPPGAGRTAYRIAQEALTNARKHAAGQPVHLEVSGTPGAELVIEIRNPLPALARSGTAGAGRPGSAIPGSGTGLIGLGERARLAGGRIDYGPTESGEFRLRAWLPWAR